MKRLLLIYSFLTLAGCGVKSDPVAPIPATEPGRGKPTFHRAIIKSGVTEQFDRIEDENEDERNREEEIER